MFLRCLRFALHSHEYSRESALWWSRRETGSGLSRRKWYGLGFSNTLPRYGYAWIEPRIDFERLIFQIEVTDHVLFGNERLRRQYLRRGGAVRDFHNNFVQFEQAFIWLQQYHSSSVISNRLIDWIVHLCLRQFRMDTLTTIKSEIHPDHRETALDGLRSWSHTYLKETMNYDELYLVSGSRLVFKDPLKLKEALFRYDDGRKRIYWENKPYRTLYRRACAMLETQPATARLVSRMQDRLCRWLFAFHWILPYPSVEVLVRTTKDSQRMWYSIRPVKRGGKNQGIDLQDLDGSEWKWAQKKWRTGYSPELPEYLSWATSKWEDWIKRQ